jgi:uridine kinase/ribulose-5-phosphate 4-epimerase/fuculose-1-phosphate aldolase
VETKPKVIGISGESGVGKSTIAEIIALFFGIDNTVVISTDDLHKWERTSKQWETFTHLNPAANNLELGDIHVESLSNGQFIYRSKYNHHTGYFDPPIKIEPKQIVIVEGLHSFYTDRSKQLLDLKIFIDTDEELRTHWKILRDTEERGYKYNVVLDTINKRKHDNILIREAQIKSADVIIKIVPKDKIVCLGNKSEKIDLELSVFFQKDTAYSDLFEFVKNYNIEYNNFLKISENVGNDIGMCQNGGGNISVKISDEYMIIKASGFALKDMHKSNSYSLLNYRNIVEELNSKKSHGEDSFVELVNSSVLSNKYKRPSMETGFHTLLDKYVIHLHPVYLTLLLCMENSQDLMKELYSDIDYQYVKYVSPGFPLSKQIKSLNKAKVYFLENHGLIVSSDDTWLLLSQLYDINGRAHKYIQKQCANFESFDLSFSNLQAERHYAFPDSVIFLDDITKTEIMAAHNYINMMGPQLGKLRYLTSHQVHHLKNLEAEKYRKTL